MSIAEWDHMVSEMPDGKHRRGVWEYSEWEERGQAHQCVPWANWDGPGKEYDVPEVLEFSPLRAVLVGLGFWLSLEKKQPLGVKMPLRHLVGWMQ